MTEKGANWVVSVGMCTARWRLDRDAGTGDAGTGVAGTGGAGVDDDVQSFEQLLIIRV